jgi:hypothetical protein
MDYPQKFKTLSLENTRYKTSNGVKHMNHAKMGDVSEQIMFMYWCHTSFHLEGMFRKSLSSQS